MIGGGGGVVQKEGSVRPRNKCVMVRASRDFDTHVYDVDRPIITM